MIHTHLSRHAIALAFSLAFIAFLRCFFTFHLPTACGYAVVWQAAFTLFSWPRRH